MNGTSTEWNIGARQRYIAAAVSTG